MCCDAPAADPAVAQAQAAQSKTAADSLAFQKDYYNTTMKPLVQQETAAAAQTMQQQQQMFGVNFGSAQAAANQYQQYGIPAQQNYYNQAKQFNTSDWQEQQAQSAMGDVTNAQAQQQTAMNQNMASRGISANSGMALYNQQISGTQATASGAAAANQARTAARSLGMNLTAGAANIAGGGAAQQVSLGGAASGNSIASFNAASGAVQGANTGQAGMASAYNNAGSQYGNVASTAMQGQISANNLSASSNAAGGQAIGAIAGVAAMALF